MAKIIADIKWRCVHPLAFALAVFGTLILSLAKAEAQDQMTLALGQRGSWETAVAELGQEAGIFAKHGLTLETVYTQGGGETMQTVISAAVDIGVGPSVMAVLGAYSRGAPVRILGAAATGAGDIFWYVRSDSSLTSLSDIAGETIAYSTTGSSTHEIVKAFLAQYGLEARATPTGSPPGTLTLVMSGSIDVGWAAPPFALEQLDQGDIRMIATGNDATRFLGQTVRVMVVNARTLQSEPDKFRRFMRGYRETIDWMYADPQAIEDYAAFANISHDLALRTRDAFFPRAALDPDQIVGLNEIMPIAVQLRYINQTLSAEELDVLIQIPIDE